MLSKRWVMYEGLWRHKGSLPISPAAFELEVTEPTAFNTGFRTPPTIAVVGDVVLSTGQTYSGRHITKGRIIVPEYATGVIIIEDNLVDGSGVTRTSQKAVIEIHPNTGATVIIRYNEIIGQVGMIGIGFRRFYTYRNNIHHVEDAFRLNNYNGTGQAMAVDINADYCHDLILVTPDPYDADRTDQKTHADTIQIEGGDGISIRGCALHSFHTTDGTSNVSWVLNDPPYTPQAPGTSNSRIHRQALSNIMLTPSVSPITNLLVRKNWMYGAEISINGGSGSNSSTTGLLIDNLFDQEQWHYGHTIDLDQTATGLLDSGNKYMHDGSLVQVRRTA